MLHFTWHADRARFATTKWRGAMMGAVFAMQGFGQLAAAIIALIVTAGFKKSLETADTVGHCSGVCQLAVDKMWRVVIGFGAVPASIALYYRLTIPETPRYTFDVARDIVKADEDTRAYIEGKREGNPDMLQRVSTLQNQTAELETPTASWSDFWRHYLQWKNGKVLLGTAGSWFFLDVGMYKRRSFFYFVATDTNQCNSVLRPWTEQQHYPFRYRMEWG